MQSQFIFETSPFSFFDGAKAPDYYSIGEARRLQNSFSGWEDTGGFEIAATTGKAVSQSIFRRSGLKTSSRIRKDIATLIQTALMESQALNPLLRIGCGMYQSLKNFFIYGPDPAEFNYKYLNLNKIVVPFGSQKEKELLNVRGFYDRRTDSVHLRQYATLGDALPLVIAKLSSPAFENFFGKTLSLGLSLHFANLVLAEQGLDQRLPEVKEQKQLSCVKEVGKSIARSVLAKPPEPPEQKPLRWARDLAGLVGNLVAGKAYFENHVDLINHLTTKLSIGRFRVEELAKELREDALRKTPLLFRTARFANHQMKNMVGVGITGPRAVRIWMRSDISGIHELQIIGGTAGTKSTKIEIKGGLGDKTTAITYPRSSENSPLTPLTKYRYRIVRKSDGTPLGEGSFETAPASDGDTPQKVSIALMSCHQPFAKDGSIEPESDRMLRLLPRILQENNVKFVLPCGDQIYADEPGDLSLFTNPYLVRQVFPGKKSIKELSVEEVRQLFDMRYRTFWSTLEIRKMYANYPCYPTLDDHEIEDSWGTHKEHSSPDYRKISRGALDYRKISRGALDAYFDYQISGVLPPVKRLPDSFHYKFSYGNIGVFVMDIRSERFTNSRDQIYSDVQLNDLRIFLRDNSDKKVLFIVVSVPIVFVPGLLARVGAKFKPDTFHDHWSHPRNVPARDRLLSMLHAHQQAHPNQRLAILSGDVHIGNAAVIKWRGGSKPRLYQFTSSAVSALETRTDHCLTAAGPSLIRNINCRTPSGGAISGEISHLPVANNQSGRNPYTELNVGIIEVQRFGNASNLKFKLIGSHPTEERPVTYFESGWLG